MTLQRLCVQNLWQTSFPNLYNISILIFGRSSTFLHCKFNIEGHLRLHLHILICGKSSSQHIQNAICRNQMGTQEVDTISHIYPTSLCPRAVDGEQWCVRAAGWGQAEGRWLTLTRPWLVRTMNADKLMIIGYYLWLVIGYYYDWLLSNTS